MKFFRFSVSLLGSFAALLFFVQPGQADASVDFTSEIRSGEYKDRAIDTAHFTFEFSEAIANGTDADGDAVSDLVEQIAESAEFSWGYEVNDAQFPSPLKNQDRLFMILDDAAEYVTEDSYGITHIFDDGTIYIALDPSSTEDVLKVTIAHELIHAIQFGYVGFYVGYNQDLYFAEATAVWAEDYVYDEINDYWNYLPDFLSSSYLSIFTGTLPSEDSLFAYGATLWPMFLSQYLNDDTVVRRVMDSYFNDQIPDVWDTYQAYERVLDADYNKDIRELYQHFVLWNYVSSQYRDGADYPSVTIDAMHGPEDYSLPEMKGPKDRVPALFAANAIQFLLEDSMWGKEFTFELNKSAGVEFGVVVLPETDEEYLLNQVEFTIFPEDSTQKSIVQTIDPDVDRLTFILTPLSQDPAALESDLEKDDDAFGATYPYSYSFDIEGMAVVEVEIEETEEEKTEENEAVPPEEENEDSEFSGGPAIETEDEAFNVSGLKITDYDANSVSLQWSRVIEDGLKGYYVYYGTESEKYDSFYEVVGSQKTRATVSGLLPSSTYYFVVVAYDEDGRGSEAYSNEVDVELQLSNFLDVNATHGNYHAIQFLSYLNVIKGYGDGTFKPAASINRAELMKILVLGASGIEPNANDYQNCFPDVQSFSVHWFSPYVCYAAEQGWVKGYTDGLFHPENPVTKAEALKMILEASDIKVPGFVSTAKLPYDDVYGAAWYAPYVVTAYERGLLEETDGSFSADRARTRAEVTEELFREIVAELMSAEVYTNELLDQFLAEWEEVF